MPVRPPLHRTHAFPKHLCGLFLSVFFMLLLISMKCVAGNDKKSTYEHFISFFQLQPNKLLYRPWTIITYIFALTDPYVFFLGMLIEMWVFYRLCSIASEVLSYRQLVVQIILTTILTGLMFCLIFSGKPKIPNIQGYRLLGLGCLVSATVYAPYLPVTFLIFRFPLYHLCLFLVLTNFLGATVESPLLYIPDFVSLIIGISYGAALRALKAHRRRKKSIRRIKFNPGPKGSLSPKDITPGAPPSKELRNLDAILKKVSTHGYHMLTAEEKRILYEGSK